MATTYAAASSVSTRSVWTGRVLSALGALFMTFDGIIHILRITPVVDAFAQLGFPLSASRALGIIEIVCVVLYLLPRTTVLGAILLTGYLGGPRTTQINIGSPLFSTTLFPVYVALLLWGGLYFRDERVRNLIPLRR